MVMYDNIMFVIRRSGGMADALDSKSSEHPLMRVRVPPSAPNKKSTQVIVWIFYFLLIIKTIKF
jgi:hypothetical protein